MWAILDRTWAISGGAGMWAMQAAKELMWAFIGGGAVECGQFVHNVPLVESVYKECWL